MSYSYDRSSASSSAALPHSGPQPPDYGSNSEQAGQLPGSDELDMPALSAASTAGGPSTKSEALAWHRESVQRVDRLLRSSLAQQIDPDEDDASRTVLLRNSAEFIDTGMVGLQVLDATHDAATRAPAGQTAYFDTRAAWNGPADYDETNPANNAGIQITFPESGHYDPGSNTMVFTEALTQGESDLANTLIHEMQHMADGGPNHMFERGIVPPGQGNYRAPPWVYRDYASEYRARIIDPIEAEKYGDPAIANTKHLQLTATRDPNDPDVISGKLPPTASTPTNFSNEQQQSVFDEMIRNPAPTSWFDYPSQSWTAIYGYFPHYYVLDPQFAAYADGIGDKGQLAGGNMVNSVRIELLAQAMDSGAPDADILAAAADLDTIDCAFLQSPDAAPFWKGALRALSSRLPLYAQVQAEVMGRSWTDPTAETYTVVKGDTLYEIAGRILGAPQRYLEIAKLNGIADPDRIEEGAVLKMPV